MLLSSCCAGYQNEEFNSDSEKISFRPSRHFQISLEYVQQESWQTPLFR